MKLVVTGALGYIGSHFIRRVASLHPGAELILVDNLSTCAWPSLFDLPRAARYHFREADVREVDLAPLARGADAVVHLAAIADAGSPAWRDPEGARHNFDATRRVAEACAAAGAPLVFPSSTSVYGPAGDEVSEESPDADLRPQSPYADSKLREERLLAATAGLRFAILRFGTIFGRAPGMRFHTAVARFCWQAATGAPVTVWRTALAQLRPYLAVDDAARAIDLLVAARRFDGRVHDAVTTHATVGEVLDRIRAHAPALEVALVDAPHMNTLSYRVTGGRLRALGFAPAGDLARGVAETMAALGDLR